MPLFSVVRMLLLFNLKTVTKKTFNFAREERVFFERLWYLVTHSPGVFKWETELRLESQCAVDFLWSLGVVP